MGISRISVDIKTVNRNIASLRLTRCNPSDTASIRRSVNLLWEPLTSALHQQAIDGHRCSFSVEACGLGLSIDGNNQGTLRDPLGLVPAMTAAKISGLEFAADRQGVVRTGHLEKTMIALLSGGFKPVHTPAGTVHVLDDIFIDESDRGLPVSPNISYSAEKACSGPAVPKNIDSECRRLMLLTRKYISPDIPVENRDADSAIGIWRQVLVIDPAFNQKARIVGTVCHIARQLYDLDLPVGSRDMPNVTKLWTFAKEVADSDERLSDEKERLRKSMMDMADKCSLTDVPKEERDIDSSILVWRAILAMWDCGDHRRRALLSMVNKAGEISSANIPFEERDVEGAVKIWRAIHELDNGENIAVKDTLMKTANRLMASHGAAAVQEIAAALRLWFEAYEIEPSGVLRSSMINNAVKILHINARELAVDVLREENAHVSGNFRMRCLANLYYLAKYYDKATEIVDANFMFDREMLYLKAECLRKQRKYGEAVELATGIIDSDQENGIFARMQAHLCRGYCRLVVSRKKDTAILTSAIRDFDTAISMAGIAGLPIPPRAFTGMGLACWYLGDSESARMHLEKALELDPGNAKAEKILRSITQ